MQKIDYYGKNDNYIHLKFGDVRKMYNFTSEFIKKYPSFTKEYASYFSHEKSAFQNPFQIVSYVYKKRIPVNFYYNFTDTPAKGMEDILNYLLRESTYFDDSQIINKI
jgi:hypothetical protein